MLLDSDKNRFIYLFLILYFRLPITVAIANKTRRGFVPVPHGNNGNFESEKELLMPLIPNLSLKKKWNIHNDI